MLTGRTSTRYQDPALAQIHPHAHTQTHTRTHTSLPSSCQHWRVRPREAVNWDWDRERERRGKNFMEVSGNDWGAKSMLKESENLPSIGSIKCITKFIFELKFRTEYSEIFHSFQVIFTGEIVYPHAYSLKLRPYIAIKLTTISIHISQFFVTATQLYCLSGAWQACALTRIQFFLRHTHTHTRTHTHTHNVVTNDPIYNRANRLAQRKKGFKSASRNTNIMHKQICRRL